jgi:hypothetical protein
VRLLFEMPHHKVAEELGIRTETLRRWKGQKDFKAAMAARLRESQQDAERIVSESLAHAAAWVRELTVSNAQGKKPDLKVVTDMLKAGGVFEKVGKSDGAIESLDSVIARVVGENGAENRP